jgi:hypothetical protein
MRWLRERAGALLDDFAEMGTVGSIWKRGVEFNCRSGRQTPPFAGVLAA